MIYHLTKHKGRAQPLANNGLLLHIKPKMYVFAGGGLRALRLAAQTWLLGPARAQSVLHPVLQPLNLCIAEPQP